MFMTKNQAGGHHMKINKQINTFEERFSEDVVTIIAVTGPSGVGAGKAGQASLDRFYSTDCLERKRPYHNRKCKTLLANR